MLVTIVYHLEVASMVDVPIPLSVIVIWPTIKLSEENTQELIVIYVWNIDIFLLLGVIRI